MIVLGLDAASSTELLTHLNTLAASNHTVVLTIHQPRLEIFHMFKRIVVLSEGKVCRLKYVFLYTLLLLVEIATKQKIHIFFYIRLLIKEFLRKHMKYL